jgi:hypothetical protein
MNEQQKAFAKETIDEYQSEVNDLYYKINRNGVFAFCGLGMAIAILAVGGELTPSETVDNVVAVLSGASVITNGISAVKRIVRREALKQRIREIEYDLTMDDLSTDKPKVYQKTPTIEKK